VAIAWLPEPASRTASDKWPTTQFVDARMWLLLSHLDDELLLVEEEPKPVAEEALEREERGLRKR